MQFRIPFLVACLVGTVAAITGLSHTAMTHHLDRDIPALALAAAPMWFFGKLGDNDPCYPTSATDAGGHQTLGVEGCDYPDVGCHCRNPDVPPSSPGPPFPVYVSARRCQPGEVRVAYSLFYQKDGTKPEGGLGHPLFVSPPVSSSFQPVTLDWTCLHLPLPVAQTDPPPPSDWERVIVIWTQPSRTSANTTHNNPRAAWSPTQLLLSQHFGYQTLNWSDIPHTFSTPDACLPRGGPDDVKGENHPKVYVSWSKHANYATTSTHWRDLLSQFTDNAFRSDDWWYFPATKSEYLQADGATALGRTLAGFRWGLAESHPAKVHDEMCGAE